MSFDPYFATLCAIVKQFGTEQDDGSILLVVDALYVEKLRGNEVLNMWPSQRGDAIMLSLEPMKAPVNDTESGPVAVSSS